MVSRLRLMNTTARHDLPDDPDEQVKLARLLGYPDREKMLIDCEKLTARKSGPVRQNLRPRRGGHRRRRYLITAPSQAIEPALLTFCPQLLLPQNQLEPSHCSAQSRPSHAQARH